MPLIVQKMDTVSEKITGNQGCTMTGVNESLLIALESEINTAHTIKSRPPIKCAIKGLVPRVKYSAVDRSTGLIA